MIRWGGFEAIAKFAIITKLMLKYYEILWVFGAHLWNHIIIGILDIFRVLRKAET